jgi:putative ABC transport system ATP-binding protein
VVDYNSERNVHNLSLCLFYYALQTLSNNADLPAAIPHSNAEQGKALIQARGLVKKYRTAAGDFTAIKGIDLDVYPGEFLGIVGKSGAGKSTLVNLLTGVDYLTAGEVWVDGVPVHQLDENQRAQWRGSHVGLIYQAFHLMPTLSLLDNVMLPMDFTGLYHGRTSPERAMALLRQVGLEEHAYKPPSAISGGQQQRVAIARALVNDPPVIIADEPTGRLDSATAEIIFNMFRNLLEQGKTLVMVTHDRSLKQRVSRVIEIADGVIVEPAMAGGEDDSL